MCCTQEEPFTVAFVISVQLLDWAANATGRRLIIPKKDCVINNEKIIIAEANFVKFVEEFTWLII